MATTIRISPKGAARWVEGHPWIYRTDVLGEAELPGVVHVEDRRGKFLGQALWSPKSEIRLRLIEPTKRKVDGEWWRERITSCLARRDGIDATAYRVVHGEGDGLPSLVVDLYDRWLVVQLLSAGLETMRDDIIAALVDVLKPDGILLRNDASVRKHEGLDEGIELVHGAVPETVEVREGSVKFLAAPWSGQKTGAFLDQRDNRVIAGALAREGGTALDCFAYHGSFAMHLAKRSGRVTAVDQSKEALVRGTENAVLNGFSNIDWVEADAFELVRSWERAGRKFDTIVVDPPAFAKSKSAVAGALRGYHEINLRAMRLLAPGGTLLTASCSFHVRLPMFLEMLSGAASDSGRRLTLARVLGQGQDHPEIVTVPETGYLKGAVLVAV